MTTLHSRLVIGLLMLVSTGAFACMLDSDCAPFSECVVPDGNLYGVCAGGMRPGNSYDRKPVRDAFDPSSKVGKTCQHDLQCGIGATCVMGPYDLLGVCNE